MCVFFSQTMKQKSWEKLCKEEVVCESLFSTRSEPRLIQEGPAVKTCLQSSSKSVRNKKGSLRGKSEVLDNTDATKKGKQQVLLDFFPEKSHR